MFRLSVVALCCCRTARSARSGLTMAQFQRSFATDGGGSALERARPPAPDGGAGGSALARARALKASAPRAQSTRHGEAEGAEWWERHAELFAAARAEYGGRDARLYPGGAAGADGAGGARLLEPLLEPRVAAALRAAGGDRAAAGRALVALCEEVAPGVWALPLFTEAACAALRAELAHYEASGIPLRRPNGMNRYGAILGDLGLQPLLDALAAAVVAPAGEALWPAWVEPPAARAAAADGGGDCAEAYGFAVRYRLGEDVALAEHADTSNVTLNVCLGVDGFDGGALAFGGVRFTPSSRAPLADEVAHARGVALLHLGGHFHAARELTAGERVNLIVWCYGEGGVVRIAPRPGYGIRAYYE